MNDTDRPTDATARFRETVTAEPDRRPQAADTLYQIRTYELENGEYAATEADSDWEARGHSPAEAIANYALAIDCGARPTSDDQEVLADGGQ